jgi:hypothetical protein
VIGAGAPAVRIGARKRVCDFLSEPEEEEDIRAFRLIGEVRRAAVDMLRFEQLIEASHQSRGLGIVVEGNRDVLHRGLRRREEVEAQPRAASQCRPGPGLAEGS